MWTTVTWCHHGFHCSNVPPDSDTEHRLDLSKTLNQSKSFFSLVVLSGFGLCKGHQYMDRGWQEVFPKEIRKWSGRSLTCLPAFFIELLLHIWVSLPQKWASTCLSGARSSGTSHGHTFYGGHEQVSLFLLVSVSLILSNNVLCWRTELRQFQNIVVRVLGGQSETENGYRLLRKNSKWSSNEGIVQHHMKLRHPWKLSSLPYSVVMMGGAFLSSLNLWSQCEHKNKPTNHKTPETF